MATTIQVSGYLQQQLARMRLFERETYEEVIWNLIEDSKAVNEQTRKDVETSRAQIRAGKCRTLAQVKRELGF